MADKVNLEVCGEELTAHFHIAAGLAAPCYYCDQLGKERMVILEHIEQLSGAIISRGKLFTAAREKLERELLSGRAICKTGSECEMKYIYAQFASTEVMA